MECKMNNDELIKLNDLNWCIDILKRIDNILRKTNVSVADLNQVHWLVKQGLKVQKEDE